MLIVKQLRTQINQAKNEKYDKILQRQIKNKNIIYTRSKYKIKNLMEWSISKLKNSKDEFIQQLCKIKQENKSIFTQ